MSHILDESAHSENPSLPVQIKAPTDEMKVYKIFLYVKQFRPEDICIKLLGKDLVISGKHNEQLDLHGLVTREFRRTYTIPEGYEPRSVSSVFGPHGVLKIFILHEKLWDEFNKVKASIFRGYINLNLLDSQCIVAARLADQISIESKIRHPENAAKEKNVSKRCSVPLNTFINMEFHEQLLELSGGPDIQEKTSKSKDSTPIKKEQAAVTSDGVRETLKSSTKNSDKSVGSPQLAEASELPTEVEKLSLQQPDDPRQAEGVPDDPRQAECGSDDSRQAECGSDDSRQAECGSDDYRQAECGSDDSRQAESVPDDPRQAEGVPDVPHQAEGVPDVPRQAEGVPDVPRQAEGVPDVPRQAEGVPDVPRQAEGVRVPDDPRQAEGVPDDYRAEGDVYEGLARRLAVVARNDIANINKRNGGAP